MLAIVGVVVLPRPFLGGSITEPVPKMSVTQANPASDSIALADERPVYSVADTLATVAAHVPRALVTEEAWRAVLQAASVLPAALASGVYLETRLAGERRAVDLIVRVDGPGRDLLASRNPVVRLPRGLREHPVWARVARLSAGVAEGGPAVLRHVDHLWLEFDLDPADGAEPVPVPSLFVAPDPCAAASLSVDEWMALLDACAEVLLPGGLSGGMRKRLRRAVAARPAGGSIPYLGFMLARPDGAVRVYLAGMGEAELPGCLARAGWPGEGDELAAALAALGPPESRPRVGMAHVDVDARGVLPRLGVEYTLDRRRQLRGEIAESAFLRHLAASGLCDGARIEGLWSWPGWQVRRLAHEIWESRMVRRVNCVKLVLGAGSAPETKGYLLATHHPAVRLARAGGR